MALWITLYVLFRANSKLAFPKSQFEHFSKATADARRVGFINLCPAPLTLLIEFPTHKEPMFSVNLCGLLFTLPFQPFLLYPPLQAVQLSVLGNAIYADD